MLLLVTSLPVTTGLGTGLKQWTRITPPPSPTPTAIAVEIFEQGWDAVQVLPPPVADTNSELSAYDGAAGRSVMATPTTQSDEIARFITIMENSSARCLMAPNARRPTKAGTAQTCFWIFGLVARRWLGWLRFALGTSAFPARSFAASLQYDERRASAGRPVDKKAPPRENKAGQVGGKAKPHSPARPHAAYRDSPSMSNTRASIRPVPHQRTAAGDVRCRLRPAEDVAGGLGQQSEDV
jgi:hypothetical protein